MRKTQPLRTKQGKKQMENETYKVYEADSLLKNISYPGRGIILGTTPDKKHFALAYFISGRSENSRNRVFEKTPDGTLRTIPFDPSKVTDPSLIIYNAVRQLQKSTIVTNGDQTDTVFDGMSQGKTFSESLESRCFEPDFPNFTPRISGILYAGDENKAKYELSILKAPTKTARLATAIRFLMRRSRESGTSSALI